MTNYFIKRDQSSWRWKEHPLAAWNHFDNSVIDQKTMHDYLTLNQKLNAVTLNFVNNDLRPAAIFEVRRPEGKIKVSMNGGEREFSLNDWDLIDPNEILQYHHDRTTDEVNEQANKVSGILPRVQFYKQASDQLMKENYKNLLTERMNDSSIKNYLTEREPQKAVEVFFID